MSRYLLLLLWAFVPQVFAQAPADPSTALHAFFDAQWERTLREAPELASYRGDARYNDRWSDQSMDAIEGRQAADRAALVQLRAIDRGALAAADQLNYDVALWQLEKAVERQQYREFLRPVS